jgi:hypothetical protein
MKESIKKKFDSIDKSKIKVESTKELLGKLEKGLNSKTQENVDKAEALLDKFIAQAKAKNADIFVSNKPAPTLTPTAKKKANQVVKSKLDSLMDTIANDPLLKDFNNSRRTKGGGKSDPLIDSERKAIQSGPRVSKQGWKNQYGKSTGGRKYYEYRENRIDRKAPNYGSRPWLKEGGFIHPSDANADKYVVVEIQADGSRREHNNFGDLETARMFASLKREFLPKGSQLIIEDKDGKKLYRSFKSGGYMSDGGYVVADMNYKIKGSFDTENEANEYAKELSRKDGEIYRFGTKEKIARFAKEDGYMADGGLVAYADWDYDNQLGNFKNRQSARNFAVANIGKYDELIFEDESGDNIVVSKDDTKEDINYLFFSMADGGMMTDGGKYYVMDAKDGKIVSKGFDTEEEAKVEKFKIFEKTNNFFLTQKKMAKGGYVDIEAQLIKELQKLQRDLNSDRLSTYKEGDNSDEEKARKRERESKLVRFNEILELLHEIQAKKMEHGGKIDESTAMVLSQNKAIAHHTEELKKAISKNEKVEPWVIGKMQRATTDISDVTHYFDGMTEYANGGYLKDELPYDNAVYRYLEGKDILIYSMGVKQPTNYKIGRVTPPNPKYSIPTLILEVGMGEERIDGVEKIKNFVNGKMVDMTGKEAYAIKLNLKAEPKTPTGNYTNRRDLKLIIIKNPNKNGKKNYLSIDKSDFLDGLHKFSDGGKLTDDYTYIKRSDVTDVVYRDDQTSFASDKKPKNGFWVSKKALIDAGMNATEKPTTKLDFGTTSLRKGENGWKAKNSVDNYKGYDWEITTMKSMRGDLITRAVGGKTKRHQGYSTFEYVMYQDPNITLMTSKPARITDKAVGEQHKKALELFESKVSEKYAKGGDIGFEGLSKKVAKNYVGDKVKPKYQKEYGKTYDKAEAKEVGNKVAAKVYRRQLAKMEHGGKLPEDMGRYFIKTSKTKVVKMSELIPLRKRATGIVNAEKNMKMAYEGTMDKRKPITIYKSQGKYRVLDGNSTYAVAKANGWENIWAEIVKNPNMNTYQKRGNDIFSRAKSIRKEGEAWKDALQRAKAMK